MFALLYTLPKFSLRNSILDSFHLPCLLTFPIIGSVRSAKVTKKSWGSVLPTLQPPLVTLAHTYDRIKAYYYYKLITHIIMYTHNMIRI